MLANHKHLINPKMKTTLLLIISERLGMDYIFTQSTYTLINVTGVSMWNEFVIRFTDFFWQVVVMSGHFPMWGAASPLFNSFANQQVWRLNLGVLSKLVTDLKGSISPPYSWYYTQGRSELWLSVSKHEVSGAPLRWANTLWAYFHFGNSVEVIFCTKLPISMC